MTSCLPRILVTGADGQVGSALRQHPLAKEFMTFCSRQELDITQTESIEKALHKFTPDIIINAAAYTQVDKAEEEQEMALLVNDLGCKNLAFYCEQQQITLIHLGTDYIFDGVKQSPYHEEDPVSPLNFYGQSKFLGEEKIRQYCEKHFILRVSGVFSEFKTNFVKTILRLAKEKEELTVVSDQITSPTYAGDIASVLLTFAKQAQHSTQWGTYHYCSDDMLSWHAFASAILKEAAKYQSFKTKEVRAIPSTQFKSLAKRPSYSVMNCTKIYSTFGIKQSNLQASLQHVLTRLLREKL